MRRLLLALPVLLVAGCDPIIGADCTLDTVDCVDYRSADATVITDAFVVDGGVSPVDAVVTVVDAATISLADAQETGDAASVADAASILDAAEFADAGPIDATPQCAIDENFCGGACIPTDDDPDNCGSCNVVCSSGLCTAGVCAGVTGGRIVLIGHDYVNSRVGMNRLVGNAVFLASGASVRVAVYTQYAHPSAVSGTTAAIDQVATETGRAWQRTEVGDAALLGAALTNADVLVIYSQKLATDVILLGLGTSWQSQLSVFLSAGGVVVVLDGDAPHAGTFQVLAQAGLLQVSSRVSASGNALDLVAPGNAIAIGVPATYANENSTVNFVSSESTVVVRDGAKPVVIHKVF